MSESPDNPEPYEPEYPIDTAPVPTKHAMAAFLYLIIVIALIIGGIYAQVTLAGSPINDAITLVSAASILWATSFLFSIRRRRGGLIVSIFFLLAPSVGTSVALLPDQYIFQVHYHLLLSALLLASIHVEEIRRFDRRISDTLTPPW